ncbi:hypothetical protein RVV06_001797 [Enterobacter ludwigii]|nr:hypothetical protein [Enterobacter ludwigii]
MRVCVRRGGALWYEVGQWGVHALALRARRLACFEDVPPGGGILGGVYSLSML